MKIRKMLLAACAAVQLSACAEVAEAPDEMSWEEFEAQTYREPWPNGVYIVDGDIPVVDEAALREIYEQSHRDAAAIGKTTSALIVNRTNGADTKWGDAQKMNISYCISDTFETNKSLVVSAMNAATASWEASGLVNFVYVSSLDNACTASQTGVVFDVRPIVNATYAARAFLPNQARSTRNLLINNTAFYVEPPLTLAGVLRHELGHTLGFRHEHTRPEAGTCFEDNSWRALTSYDSGSVMHAPGCNGLPTASTDLTAKDRDGLVALYGEEEEEEEGETRSETASGSVAQGAWKQFAAITVKPGSRFKAVTSGTGDVDLHVRFGAPPTRTSFNCRPFAEGSAETCDITVPTNITQVYVGLHGYMSSSYRLTVTYVVP